MLDTLLADRYCFELPKTEIKTHLPINITRIPRTLVEKIEPKKIEQREKEEKTRAQEEISDAVAEIIGEMKIELKPQKVDVDEQKIIIYSLMDQDHKVMDYSKLGYGKVAAPLSIEYNYTSYEKDDSGNSASHQSTITVEDAEKVIQEKAFSDLLKTSTSNISPAVKEQFKYWKLFNDALNKMKYDLAFA